MSETPTPRTDAFASPLRGLGTGYYQALEFARILERELITARARIAELERELKEANASIDFRQQIINDMQMASDNP